MRIPAGTGPGGLAEVPLLVRNRAEASCPLPPGKEVPCLPSARPRTPSWGLPPQGSVARAAAQPSDGSSTPNGELSS